MLIDFYVDEYLDQIQKFPPKWIEVFKSNMLIDEFAKSRNHIRLIDGFL